MGTISKSFVLRKIQDGETVYIVRDITTEDGAGAALLQAYDPATGTYAPDWTREGEQPVVTLQAYSSTGQQAPASSCAFAYDGQDIPFSATADAGGWHYEEGTEPRFACRISGGRAQLKTVANLSAGDGRGKTLSYRLAGQTAAGTPYVCTGSVDYLFPLTPEGAYWLQIAATQTTLGLLDGDTEVASSTLTALCGRGAGETAGGYVTWYRSGEPFRGPLPAGEAVTVTRADIDGAEVFSAELSLSASGTPVVARDGITLYDMADEYLAAYRVAEGDGTVSETGSTTLAPYILKNLEEVPDPAGVAYEHEIYNSLGQLVRTAEGGSVTVTRADCAYESNGTTLYGDVEVRCTASW